MYALFRHREDPLLRKEELLNGAFNGSVGAVGGITLEAGPVKGSDSALWHGLVVVVGQKRLFRTYSHSHFRSKAVLGLYQRRK